jgi:cation transport ATPase
MATRVFSSLPKEIYIAGLTLLAIALHLTLRYVAASPPRTALVPLFVALIIGGIPLVFELAKKLFKMEFGSDLLAGVSILTAVLLAQYLVATIVVLMLSGGAALEFYAVAKASSVLDALAKRVPGKARISSSRTD